MWERFGFYLMLGIFVLYMQAGANGPGARGEERARHAGDESQGHLRDSTSRSCTLTPFIGGLLADRFLGYRRVDR
jgi:POT family proton-dependent oligopeptide transporter